MTDEMNWDTLIQYNGVYRKINYPMGKSVIPIAHIGEKAQQIKHEHL